MDNQDYIKEGAELADGWGIDGIWRCVGDAGAKIHDAEFDLSRPLPNYIKAALAAQLTEQVDATDYRLDIGPKGTVLYEPQGGMFESPGLNSDRAMNTIKVIVDSRVLKEPITAKAADNNTE